MHKYKTTLLFCFALLLQSGSISANHSDIDPEDCPDYEELGEAYVSLVNVGDEEYITLAEGEIDFTVFAEASTTGYCETWSRNTYGQCELIDTYAYVNSFTLWGWDLLEPREAYRLKDIDNQSHPVNGEIITLSHALKPGAYKLIAKNLVADTDCITKWCLF